MPYPYARRRRTTVLLLLTIGAVLGGCQSFSRSPRTQASGPSAARSPLSRLEIPRRSKPATAAAQPTKQRPTSTAQSEAPLTPPPPPEAAPVATAAGEKPADDAVRPAATPSEDASATEPTPEEKAARIRQLYARAADKFAGVNDYVARFHKREFVNGKQQSEDILWTRFRKQPFSVHFKWLEGTAHENREIIFVKGKYQNKMQIKLGKGDPLPGMRTSLDPHSERALANNRRAIDEAGIGNMIARFGAAVDAFDKGTNRFGTLDHLGAYPRPESPSPLECVVQHVPPGVEKHLPHGGQRFWFFNADPEAIEYALPVLVITNDDKKKEVEYYCHDRFSFNVCRPEDFDADAVLSGRNKAKR